MTKTALSSKGRLTQRVLDGVIPKERYPSKVIEFAEEWLIEKGEEK